ncbi:MAG: hypothetical protein V4773_27945 [Verrucomicrobiota bacterium]
MDPHEKRFLDLARLARKAPSEPRNGELPPGLATRVLAQVRAGDAAPALPWERVVLRAVPLGIAAAAVCCFYAWPALKPMSPDERGLAAMIVTQQLGQ